MSKLEELIQQYCPDGVEWKTLKVVLKIRNGRDYKHLGEGPIPVYGSGGIMTYVDTPMYTNPSVLIPRKGSIDKLYYVDTPFWNVDTVFYTEIDTAQVVEKYVYYVLQKEHLEKLNTAGGVPSLTQSVLNEVIIPVPPLPVQEEIVRILDAFTELQAELQAELQKRKQQYNYYRDNLLAFEDKKDIQWKHLGDICDIKGRIGFRGYTREDQVKEGEGALSLSPSNIQDGQMDYSKGTYITWSKYDESPEIKTYNGDIIFCKTASVGKVAVVKNLPYKATINPQLVVLKNIQCSASFLAYVLETNSIQSKVISMAGVGSVPNISQKALSDIYIPIPSLYEQQRLVDILDMFNALANDLAAGLPAEIEKRRLQYEYYRDKLLAFKRKGA